MIIDGVEVSTENFEATDEQLVQYVEFAKSKESDVKKVSLTLCEDGMVDVKIMARHEKFERLRRITGYISGDLNTWNDSKRAEERERVKHA